MASYIFSNQNHKEMKKDWLCRVADASYTIYYDPEPIDMKQFGYE